MVWEMEKSQNDYLEGLTELIILKLILDLIQNIIIQSHNDYLGYTLIEEEEDIIKISMT